MGLTDKQREDRARGLGASDVPAALGLDPWRSAYDLWLILTGKVDPPEAGEAAEIGQVIEGAIGTLTERRTGRKVCRPTATFVADNGAMRANVDFMLDEARKGADIVEAKSTGIVEGWGEPGSDDVPERVLVQVTAQFICSGSQFAHVARLLGRYGFRFDLYDVARNANLAEAVEQGACDFWTKHVLADVPPPDSYPSLELAKVMKRTPAKVMHWMEPGAVSHYKAWRLAKSNLKVAEELEAERRALVLSCLEDAEAAVDEEGATLVTFFKTKDGQKFDDKRFKAAHPELAKEYTKPVPGHRVLLDKATKAKE